MASPWPASGKPRSPSSVASPRLSSGRTPMRCLTCVLWMGSGCSPLRCWRRMCWRCWAARTIRRAWARQQLDAAETARDAGCAAMAAAPCSQTKAQTIAAMSRTGSNWPRAGGEPAEKNRGQTGMALPSAYYCPRRPLFRAWWRGLVRRGGGLGRRLTARGSTRSGRWPTRWALLVPSSASRAVRQCHSGQSTIS